MILNIVKIKLLLTLIPIIIILSLFGFSLFSQDQLQQDTMTSDTSKIKFEMESIFDIYGFDKDFQIIDGKQIMTHPEFRLNPENEKLYQQLSNDSEDNTVVIYPIFTASAYDEPGFYTYFRNECDETCLTIKINDGYTLNSVSSGNGFQVLKLLDYEIISDIDVDTNPDILKKYDKVILLHNEYVTKNEFDAIIDHPKVIYLYPNALYAEVKVDYLSNSIILQKGHNYPNSQITNGFDWEFDNSPLEYDLSCKDMTFRIIPNGYMLNCYPENKIHQSEVLLRMIKDL